MELDVCDATSKPSETHPLFGMLTVQARIPYTLTSPGHASSSCIHFMALAGHAPAVPSDFLLFGIQ